MWNQLRLQESTRALIEPIDQFDDLALVLLSFVLVRLTVSGLSIGVSTYSAPRLLEHNFVETV